MKFMKRTNYFNEPQGAFFYGYSNKGLMADLLSVGYLCKKFIFKDYRAIRGVVRGVSSI